MHALVRHCAVLVQGDPSGTPQTPWKQIPPVQSLSRVQPS